MAAGRSGMFLKLQQGTLRGINSNMLHMEYKCQGLPLHRSARWSALKAEYRLGGGRVSG